MTHVASEATRANHSGVITAPSFVSGNEHATAKPGQARADVPPLDGGARVSPF